MTDCVNVCVCLCRSLCQSCLNQCDKFTHTLASPKCTQTLTFTHIIYQRFTPMFSLGRYCNKWFDLERWSCIVRVHGWFCPQGTVNRPSPSIDFFMSSSYKKTFKVCAAPGLILVSQGFGVIVRKGLLKWPLRELKDRYGLVYFLINSLCSCLQFFLGKLLPLSLLMWAVNACCDWL